MNEHLVANLTAIRENIALAAQRANRSADNVEIVAVTKFHPLEHIIPLTELGIKTVAESRIQELQTKVDGLEYRFAVHFIGHLQTNKAKIAVKLADLIHSVDSEKLAIEIDKAAGHLGKRQDILIQVNGSREPQKGGVDPNDFCEVLRRLALLPNLRIRGLMTMAALTDDEEAIRDSFRLVRELRDEAMALELPGVSLEHLSMGMSEDYTIAVEEGATLVRIGSALFKGLEE